MKSSAILSATLLLAAGLPLTAAAQAKLVSVVRVNATSQSWDYFHPWTKHAPVSHRGLGAVLPNGEVLVTAELVENSDYVELERAESGEKVPATLVAADYESDLALLKPTRDGFLAGITPLEITEAGVGDHLAVWQLESTGALLSTDALLTTVEVSRYPQEDMALLSYQMTTSLQYREGSFTLPIAKGNKLAGLLLRYDTRTQNASAIPAPVIEHFLRDAATSSYGGFPKAGVLTSPARDPQLRRYCQVPPLVPGGVYVSHVERDSPAEKAGVQAGDMLLAVGGNNVDQDGNYTDAKYGKLSLVNLISLQPVGAKLQFKLMRQGKPITADLALEHKAAESYVIAPYIIDKPPQFYVVGGLVLEQLSRQYLKEWGADWAKKAPERLVYYDHYQSDLFHGDRKHLVILSHVLPTQDTLGYEELSGLVVTKINDVTLHSFADVPGALAHPVNGFHKIEFEENPKVIYLDAKEVSDHAEDLMRNYGLPEISRTE